MKSTFKVKHYCSMNHVINNSNHLKGDKIKLLLKTKFSSSKFQVIKRSYWHVVTDPKNICNGKKSESNFLHSARTGMLQVLVERPRIMFRRQCRDKKWIAVCKVWAKCWAVLYEKWRWFRFLKYIKTLHLK